MKASLGYGVVMAAMVVGWAVSIHALPVTKTKKDEYEATSAPEIPDVETALEYERYLKEVVEALESDPDFRKKLDKAAEADIRSGKIAQELDYVNHHVRTKLDEIKRRELERLRTLANKQYELSNDIDRDHLKVPQHLNHANEHSFEIEDLLKLIKKTSEDLAEADRKRRADFKEYEMQKEFEREMALQEMNEEQRKEFQRKQDELKQKHKKHEKIHQPGNKAQLEEVWEKQDHMDRQDFDPHSFFMIHDVDGNGFWDENEVKALFIKELDKVYQSNMPEDDMRERAEEMERMREHVFQESDTNRDGLISFQEFLDQTKREEFNRDYEWQTVDQQPQYTHEEYLEFERRRKEEIDRMIAQGMLPAHPNMPQGYYPNDAPGGYQQNPSGHPQQRQMHYQQAQQQMPNQQQYQHHPNQPPHYQHQQRQPQQYQPIQLNPNQVYQHVSAQQEPENIPNTSTHQQQMSNKLPSQNKQQPTAHNPLPQQQPVGHNISPQEQNNVQAAQQSQIAPNQPQPLLNNNIPQQQPLNADAMLQPQQNIPNKQ
uniref:DNA-binding protein of the nucleobindin family n=1 Tax=Glossina morsitans morsitans TaxID=37546 RepID=D3TMU7_GLOMM